MSHLSHRSSRLVDSARDDERSSRRDFFRRAVDATLGVSGLAGAASLAGISAASLARPIVAGADELRRQGKACILLWMAGGPSQFETFDPKPEHANGGETKAIDTNVPGIRFAEHLPRLSQVANRLAVIRSLTTREGDHARATHLMRTSYLPIAGVQFPAVGSVAAHEIAPAGSDLPAYVRIGGGGPGVGGSAGYLGPEFDAFPMNVSVRPPENTQPTTDEERFRGRLGLVRRLHTVSKHSANASSSFLQQYDDASRMILSPKMTEFDLQREPQEVREAYGWSTPNPGDGGAPRGATNPAATAARRSMFAADCLMARRLVEAGVTFVEVQLRGWDTHADNFNQSRSLCEALDQPFARLLIDLEERGLLDRTLVVWLGEFGRTPRINPNSGRDHFPRAFSGALAGCGVRGGQTIGSTTPSGEAVEERPVGEKDLFQTIYQALGINAAKQTLTPIGRPIKFVDGGEPVKEVFG